MGADHRNDLPVLWDGHEVQWWGWHAQPSNVFICPPSAGKSEPCPACGSMTERAMNRGTIWVDKAATGVSSIGKARMQSRAVARSLMAFRCPDCRHDQVHDMTEDEFWDLDESDYTDNGSVDAEGVPQ